jgi:hypothetical protein
MYSELLSWLMTPLSGSGIHIISSSVSWHGRLMVMAWGFMLPVSLVIARYYKVMPNQDWPNELDRKFWWHAHRSIAYVACGFTMIGVFLIFKQSDYSGNFRILHAYMGWTLVFLAAIQIAGAHLRGTKGGPTAPRLAVDGTFLDLHGDHYDMTTRRIIFERIHKTIGTIAVCFAAIEIVIGMYLADAPRWMWVGLALWWFSAICWVIFLQINGRCINTYQAIWGTDPTLPGARVKPIGWGIRSLD